MEKNILVKAITQLYQRDLEKCRERDLDEKKFCELNDYEIEILSKRVEVLPIEFRSILYFYYYFDYSIADIEDVMGKEQINEKRLYAETILSVFMGLEDVMDRHSLSIACKQALGREVAEAKGKA